MIQPFSSSQRRRMLVGLFKLLVLLGAIFLMVPFVASLSSGEDKTTPVSRWIIEFPLGELQTGQLKRLQWQGRDIWVYARRTAEIALLKHNQEQLRDPRSLHSKQPQGLENSFRSVSKDYFVFIPHENRRGCQVALAEEDTEVRFTEPCYGAQYDAAGRIRKNSGHPEQQNLSVPEYIIERGVLKIAPIK